MLKNIFSVSFSIGLGLASCLISVKDVFAFTLTDTVPGSHNLYYDDWGHLYNIVGGGNQFYALGRGEAPSAFGSGFAFDPNQSIDITATDCTVDSGSLCTGPEGSGGLFRDLPVFSLIGVWSSDADAISPVETGVNPAFFIGTEANLITPDYADSLYLFLATNDGIYADNPAEFAYTVTISGADSSTPVPEPSTLLGMFGIASLTAFLRKRVHG